MPGDSLTYNLGEVLIKKGQVDEARVFSRRALELEPNII